MVMTDGTVLIDHEVKISLYGGIEMDLPQKSFSIRFAEGDLQTRLFDDSERTSFGSLLLRNSSSDAVDTHIRDCLTASLLGDCGTEILYTRSRNVALYINGQYWGLYQLEESLDTTWAAYTLGVDADSAAVLDASGRNTILGTSADKEAYAELIDHIKSCPPCESDDALSYLLERVDADAYIRFMAVWIFLGNSDQTTLRIARGADGRWQYVWTDSTWCMVNAAYDSAASCTDPKGMGSARVDDTVFLALLQVPGFREAFLTELGRLYRYLTSERMISFVDAAADEIRGEMMLHCVRWRNEDYSLFDPRTEGLDANGAYQYWLSRIERLRNTCRRRPAFVWSQIQAAFGLSDEELQRYFGDAPASWQDIIDDVP